MRRFAVIPVLALTLGCPGGGGADGPNDSRYVGTFSSQFTQTTVSNGHTGGPNVTCFNTFQVAGTIEMNVAVSGDLVEGDVRITGTETETGKSGDASCPLLGNRTIDVSAQVNSNPANLTWNGNQSTNTSLYATTKTASFAGTLSPSGATGAFTWTRHEAGDVASQPKNVTVQADATLTTTVALLLKP
jgi:hypothetical protein